MNILDVVLKHSDSSLFYNSSNDFFKQNIKKNNNRKLYIIYKQLLELNEFNNCDDTSLNIISILENYKYVINHFNIKKDDDYYKIMKYINILKDKQIIDSYESINYSNFLNFSYIQRQYMHTNYFDNNKLFLLDNGYCYNSINSFLLFKFFNLNKKIIYFTLFIIIDILIFIYCTFTIINNKQDVLSRPNNYNTVGFLIVSRSCAICCLIYTSIILCQFIEITNYISDKITYFLPISDKMFFHYTFGTKILVYGTIHSLFHLLNINDTINKCKDGCSYDDVTLIKKSEFNLNINWSYFLSQLPFFTGYIIFFIIVIFIIISILLFKFSRFTNFILFHKLISFIIFILIIIHGYKQLLGFNLSYIMVLPFLIIFILSRIHEIFYILLSKFDFYNYNKLRILNWDIQNNNKNSVITLWLSNNDSYHNIIDNKIKPACSIYISHPAISLLEWHPFTIRTGYRLSERVLSINVVGKWTNKLKTYLDNGNGIYENYIYYSRPKLSNFRFYKFYKNRIFLCSNLGITVYISLMREIILNSKNDDSVTYFIWSVNDINIISSVSVILNEINFTKQFKNMKIFIFYSNKTKINIQNANQENIQKNNIHINYNEITTPPSLKYNQIYGFYFLQTIIHNYFGYDIFSSRKLPNIVILGRFNYSNFLIDIINKSQIETKYGIFICGGKYYCNRIEKITNVYSKNSKNIYFDIWKDETI